MCCDTVMHHITILNITPLHVDPCILKLCCAAGITLALVSVCCILVALLPPPTKCDSEEKSNADNCPGQKVQISITDINFASTDNYDI